MESQELPTAAQLREFVAHIDKSLEALRSEMREGFARIDTRLTHLETRLDQIDMRLTQIDQRLNQIDSRFLHLESRLGRLEVGGLHPPTLLAWLMAGLALGFSLFALLR